jgi:RNA polymerase sigma-70 factor (family 1)
LNTGKPILTEEKHVVRLLKKSDEEAFNILFRFYSTRVYHFAHSYLRSTEESKEIVQESFIKIWEKRDGIDVNQSFSGLLFTIAHHMILNRLRKLKIESQYRLLICKIESSGIEETENRIIFSELEKASHDALHELPPRRKLIFEMIREQGMTHREVAERLNISIKTVEAQMTEAMKYLRTRLSL